MIRKKNIVLLLGAWLWVSEVYSQIRVGRYVGTYPCVGKASQSWSLFGKSPSVVNKFWKSADVQEFWTVQKDREGNEFLEPQKKTFAIYEKFKVLKTDIGLPANDKDISIELRTLKSARIISKSALKRRKSYPFKVWGGGLVAALGLSWLGKLGFNTLYKLYPKYDFESSQNMLCGLGGLLALGGVATFWYGVNLLKSVRQIEEYSKSKSEEIFNALDQAEYLNDLIDLGELHKEEYAATGRAVHLNRGNILRILKERFTIITHKAVDREYAKYFDAWKPDDSDGISEYCLSC